MKKKPNGNNLIFFSAVMLIFSAVILITVVFAWFTSSATNKVAPFVVKVAKVKTDLTYEIDGISSGGDSLQLNNAFPGVEYNFKLTVTNRTENQAELLMYFMGFTPPALDVQSGITVDMKDIFKIKLYNPSTQAYEDKGYFRDNPDQSGRVVITTSSLNANEARVIDFLLVFSNEHLYKNSAGNYVAGDINLFQGREMKISALVVEVY